MFCKKIKKLCYVLQKTLQLQKKFFSKVLSYVATNTIVKIFVLLSTFTVTGIMCWGVSNLTYDYDEKWFYDSNRLFCF